MLLDRTLPAGAVDDTTFRAATRDAARRPLAPIERHGYRAPAADRVLGGIGTAAIAALVGAMVLAAWASVDRARPRPAPALVTMALNGPVPRLQPVERPKPARPRAAAAKPAADPAPAPIVRPPAALPAAAPADRAVAAQARAPSPPMPSQPLPAPPAPAAASPAPAPASHGPDRWESRVMARITRFRRYPGDAQQARRQGTAAVRFRIDRGGRVLSAALERSSGDAELDAAAVDAVRRADPMPKPPADRPDIIELLVSIEFFVR